MVLMRPAVCLRSSPIMELNWVEFSRILIAVPLREKRMLSGSPSSMAMMAFSISGEYSTLNPEALILLSQTASARASTPSDVFEDTGITGTPRMSESASTSMVFLFLASSILVSAMTVGMPSSSASKHRTRLLTRFVASATRMTASLSPSARSLRTTLSSSEFPDRP